MSTRRAIVVRRAVSSARDARLVAGLFAEASIPSVPDLAASLASDAWGVVLVAEQAGAAVGVAVLRFLRDVGSPTADVGYGLVEALHVTTAARRQGVGGALLDAARAESEAREARRFRVIAEPLDDAGRAFLAATSPPDPPRVERPLPVHGDDGARAEVVALAPGVRALWTPAETAPPTSTLWSGALAFRTRWRDDRASLGWTVDACVGTPAVDDGDALRFDVATRRLRESYFARPRPLLHDDALLRAIAALEPASGALSLSDDAPAFTLCPMDVALFDVSLDVLVALRAGHLDALVARAARGVRALRLSDQLDLLVDDGAYVGWRVRDPMGCARPMGWPETRDAANASATHRTMLAAIVYDWMVIDASERTDPGGAVDPDEIAHMVGLRDRARSLAEVDADERDPTPGVARDIAAHIHWAWGFFRVGA